MLNEIETQTDRQRDREGDGERRVNRTFGEAAAAEESIIVHVGTDGQNLWKEQQRTNHLCFSFHTY